MTSPFFQTSQQRERQRRARAGWVPPGPVPPGDAGDPRLLPAPAETLDALCGHWRLFQPKDGHRFSTDDLLAAWFAIETFRRLGREPATALDLGCGLGTVGLLVAWAFAGTRLTGLELQASRAALARRSIRYNGIATRFQVVEGDLRQQQWDARVDLVTATPPYWRPDTGTWIEDDKALCRFELTADIESYAQAAKPLVAADGRLVLVYDGRQRERFLAAAHAAGLQPVRLREVVSRAGDPPLLLVAALAHQGTLDEEPALLLRDRHGRRSDEFDHIRQALGFPPSRGPGHG